jgi:hypothetical protein
MQKMALNTSEKQAKIYFICFASFWYCEKRCETKRKHAKNCIICFAKKKQKSCETVFVSLPFRMQAKKYTKKGHPRFAVLTDAVGPAF